MKIHDTELVTFTPSSVSGLDLDTGLRDVQICINSTETLEDDGPFCFKKADELDQITTP
ncbi:MAG: hypothetical protein M3Q75_12375 [Gemmatimonadota bacterium]|nr:hypothetical protein [Gemmatimonadota bacterium]